MTQPLADRPTKELDLPFTKGKVVVREWITGREQEAIEKPTTDSIKITPDGSGSATFGDVNPAKMTESTHKAIEIIVVSVNGATANVKELVLDLPAPDYNVVIAYIQPLIKKK